MHFVLTFKVKNAVIELSFLTMIVPIFTKGITSKSFLLMCFLSFPAISLSVTQIMSLKQQETFE